MRAFPLAATALLPLFVPAGARAEMASPMRPHIYGLARVALFVHDLDRSRIFYEDFLGFAEPFSLSDDYGKPRLAWIKIDDRQAVELLAEETAGSDRLHEIAFRTDDAEGMRRYLKAKGLDVPDQIRVDETGEAGFSTLDPDNHRVAFVQDLPGSWTVRDRGRDLRPTRVSTRMSHAGILVRNLDASLKFYGELLGFRETWRGSRDGKVLDWVTLAVPDGDDWVEFMLYQGPVSAAQRGVMHHFCLEVPDVAAAARLLQSRPSAPSGNPAVHVGFNRKRQINTYDPDGTRVEIMEARTVDGKPPAPSSAPPPPT